MDKLSPGLSIVIPVYNSSESLKPLVERLVNVMGETGGHFEIVMVNDGSRESSWEVIKKLAAAVPAVRGISLMRNYGQHNALLVGIRAARYESTVTMDDDLQHPPEELPKLMAKFA